MKRCGITSEIVAVLEGAGLALVGIDRHQPWRRLGAHQAPFAPGWKSGTTEPAQAGVADDLGDLVARARARETGLKQCVAVIASVGVESIRGSAGMRMRSLRHCCTDAFGRRLRHLRVAHRADRRVVAGAHAGRPQHAYVAAEPARQIAQQMLATNHSAGQRVADAHGDRRGRCFTLLHHVEMGVEGRDLVDLGERKLHLLSQRGQVRRREMAVAVLDEVQVLDQQIATARPVAQKGTNLSQRGWLDLPSLWRPARTAAASLRSIENGGLVGHSEVSRGGWNPIVGGGCKATVPIDPYDLSIESAPFRPEMPVAHVKSWGGSMNKHSNSAVIPN